MRSQRPVPFDEPLRWLKSNGHDVAPCTGADRSALIAIAYCWGLYTCADDRGAVLAAVQALLRTIQPKCAPLAKELIAWAMDWGDRDVLWPRVWSGEALS